MKIKYSKEFMVNNSKSSIINIQSKSAFTLIELIVAIALASILILVTAMIFKQASSAFSQSDARSEVYQNVRAAFDIIKRDISGATLNTRYELFQAFNDVSAASYSTIGAKEGSDILTLLSSTPNLADKPVALITYYLKDDNILYKLEKTDTSTLNTGISIFNLKTETEYKKLGLNVSSLQFRYYDKDAVVKWVDTWETGTNTAYQYLPNAVEVEMTVSDTLNRYTGTSTTIISIP
ncbi:MAG: prepilin-type N-terminal cleavage/methylation domain-containing protein [Candidatus Scalindua sp.]|jgi:prepilin-type N-terminal cleavage/methylation domain-containing protein|nr:prepilin-type N-terminal cleavage/methylation domain-containing protein [Candidatus Scalindua sp.]